MICVICEERPVDSLNWYGLVIESKDLVVCFKCRTSNKPGCIPELQYPRYWLAFSKKYRKEQRCLKS